MPYSKEHVARSKRKILGNAQALFTEHGFNGVTINDVMQAASMTRGAFYVHFKSKRELFVEVVRTGIMCRTTGNKSYASNASDTSYEDMVRAYLGDDHLNNHHTACPLIAFPENSARGDVKMQAAYTDVAKSIVSAFEQEIDEAESRSTALATLALAVGAMVIARGTNDARFADDIRKASLSACMNYIEASPPE